MNKDQAMEAGRETEKNLNEIAYETERIFFEKIEGRTFLLADAHDTPFKGKVIAPNGHGHYWVQSESSPKEHVSPVAIPKEKFLTSPEGMAELDEILSRYNLSEEELETVRKKMKI